MPQRLHRPVLEGCSVASHLMLLDWSLLNLELPTVTEHHYTKPLYVVKSRQSKSLTSSSSKKKETAAAEAAGSTFVELDSNITRLIFNMYKELPPKKAIRINRAIKSIKQFASEPDFTGDDLRNLLLSEEFDKLDITIITLLSGLELEQKQCYNPARPPP